MSTKVCIIKRFLTDNGKKEEKGAYRLFRLRLFFAFLTVGLSNENSLARKRRGSNVSPAIEGEVLERTQI